MRRKGRVVSYLDGGYQGKMIGCGARKRCRVRLEPTQDRAGMRPEAIEREHGTPGGKCRDRRRGVEVAMQMLERPSPQEPFVHVAHQHRALLLVPREEP